MPPHVFAVDESSLRFGSFSRAGKALEFRDFQEVELPAETFGQGLLGPTLLEETIFRERLEELLSRIGESVDSASLVVPDAWMRVSFVESGELPRSAKEREEVLLWKFRRLVPYRLDELRVQMIEVEPLPTQQEPGRHMLGFAMEGLLGQLEAAFSAQGIRIGLATNVSMCLMETIRQASGGVGVEGLVSVVDDSYTIVFVRDGVPVLHRHKILGSETTVRRELRLTRDFVEENLGDEGAERIFLFAPEASEEAWSTLVSDELGGREARRGSEFVRWKSGQGAGEPARVAPLMGAACTMVP